ncbi:MAG: protein phosphatase 2C domain-containing protein [Spirochaetaceae bacterium]|nr:protein phosphatase 2C domain-containing protein [Spirochaetaceae bacterium]
MSNYKSFATTVIGGIHIKNGKSCQDACFKHDDTDVSIVVAADGHGEDNCFRSDKGAKLAVACAAKGVQEFVKINESKFSSGLFRKKDIPSQRDFNKAIRDLIKHIIASWQTKIEEDYSTQPFTLEELEKTDEKHRKRFENGEKLSKAYGTTLIAAAITKHYWFAIHIGDGRITAMYPDGSFDQPVPWDERCYLNVTTSICDDDANEQTRCYFSYHGKKTPPVAVFLCTDGIDDNYPVDGNEKHLFKLYRTIAVTFAEDGFDSTCKQLTDLANSFATKGKGDDTSIAGFIDMEGLKKTIHIWQKQIAEEVATAEKVRAETAKAGKEEKRAVEDYLNYGGFVTESNMLGSKEKNKQ